MNAKVEPNTEPVTRPTKESAKPAMVLLKAICQEMKLDPRLAREKLRIAAREGKKFPELAKTRKPRSAWEWPKGSEAEKQARAALSA
jgi:hypothetical protein